MELAKHDKFCYTLNKTVGSHSQSESMVAHDDNFKEAAHNALFQLHIPMVLRVHADASDCFLLSCLHSGKQHSIQEQHRKVRANLLQNQQ
jgi:hypothetical protein